MQRRMSSHKGGGRERSLKFRARQNSDNATKSWNRVVSLDFAAALFV